MEEKLTPVTQLTMRAVKKINENDPQQLKGQSFVLQVLAIKEFPDNETCSDPKKAVKLRFSLSDGESTILAMMNKQIHDRLEEPLANNHVIEIFTFLKLKIMTLIEI